MDPLPQPLLTIYWKMNFLNKPYLKEGRLQGSTLSLRNPDLSLSGPVQVGLTHAPPDAWAVS